MAKLRWRNLFVVVASISVISYCAALLVHVESTRDIGLHCTFSPIVARVFPQYLRSHAEAVDNMVGCTLVQVGPYEVESCPQYLRALRLLQETPGETGVTRRHSDGEDWVRVKLRRDLNSEPFDVWCVLGRPPLESTIPAAIWLILQVGLYLIGAIVYWKRPHDRAAGPFFAITFVAVGAYVGGFHWWQIITQPILLTIL